MMDTRPYYEYPSSQAAIFTPLPHREYGSLTPAKAKRNWGNLLKLGSKKDRDILPPTNLINNSNNIYGISNGPSPVPIYATPSQEVNSGASNRNYHAEYREKYGYTATYGRSSFHAMGYVSSMQSPKPLPEADKSTMTYTDWFGSVTARRPAIRPQLPSFGNAGGNIIAEKGYQYVSAEPATPVPMQVYSNVCVCPDQHLGTTKGRKKKKCKRCGLKPAKLRHTTNIGQVKTRPSLSALMYQPPHPVEQATLAWGWHVTEEQIYGHYGTGHTGQQQRPVSFPTFSSVHPPVSEEEDSPPPTPETVKSMKSIRSVRSNGSIATLKKESTVSLRPAPPPPPKLPENIYELDSKRSSIIADNVSAYELIEEHIPTSDLDNLSDNAVNELSKNHQTDNISTTSTLTESSGKTNSDINSRISIVTISGNQSQNQCNNDMENNKIKISTSSPHKIIIKNSNTDLVTANNMKNSSLNKNDPNVVRRGKHSAKSQNRGGLENGNVNYNRSQNIKTIVEDNAKRRTNRKNINSNNKIVLSQLSNGVVRNNTDNVNYNNFVGSQIPRPNRNNRKNLATHSKSSNQEAQFRTKTSTNLDSSNRVKNSQTSSLGVDNKIQDEDVKEELMKLSDSSEIRKGGNTVRIAGQRMTILTSATSPPEALLNASFSSDEDEPENTNIGNNLNEENDKFPYNYNDDTSTSDYPVSSPATTHESDSDSNTEDSDVRISTIYTNSDKWTARSTSTIYEEDETITEDHDDSNLVTVNNHAFRQNQDNDQTSISSSSISSPEQQVIFQPTLSELLQVKSILKRPNSLDTSSETDSDFYLPTFSEFKQNQRKKKQVQFRPSDDITVVENLGETKGRKVSSLKNRKEKSIGKQSEGSDYSLLADLQDVYSRTNIRNTNEYRNTYDLQYGRKLTKEAEMENNDLSNIENLPKNPMQDESFKAHHVDQIEGNRSIELSNSLTKTECLSSRDPSFMADEQQTSETFSSVLKSKSNAPMKPIRRAPPPPRGRTISPLRPTVPPPPPPPTASVNNTPPPLPTSPPPTQSSTAPPLLPPPLPNSSPPGTPPPPLPTSPPPPLPMSLPPPLPTSPPPPLPTSPPPFLEDTGDLTVIKRTNTLTHSLSTPSFTSFKEPLNFQSSNYSPSNQDSQSPIYSSSPVFPFSPIDNNVYESSPVIDQILKPKTNLNGVLSTSNHSMFFIEEEEKTATIRGRVKPSRSSILDSALTTSTPPPPVSSPAKNHHRQRPRSASPWKEETSTRQSRKCGRRLSFLNGLVSSEEDSYDHLSDHIYEELNSSPSSPSHSSGQDQIPGKSMFDGASKYEILEYLKDARQRVAINADEDDELLNNHQDPREYSATVNEDDELREIDGISPQNTEDNFAVLTSRNNGPRSSNISSNSDSSENSGLIRTDKERLLAGEIERTDSGVGSETSKPNMTIRKPSRCMSTPVLPSMGSTKEIDAPVCDDCETSVDTHVTNSGVMYAPLVCRRCSRRRQERKEILTEIMETEIKYGRDLRVMVEQFYRPMLVAGLLSKDQLAKIFLNVEDLMEQNRQFSLQLKDAFEIALDQGDEDLLTVNVAKLFLEATPMLHAFQSYCVRQGGASLLLQSLEKERELLRIFLKVSQMENTLLRRMNLHSFLMVPVQRVTKYPLLLSRLYKCTPPTHSSREDCRKAREKIELHLQHMNNETKDASPTKLWRRISMSVGSGTPLRRLPQTPPDHAISIKLRTVALEVLQWSMEEAYVVREGRLLTLPPDSNNWTIRGKSLKMSSFHVMLITLGKPNQIIEDAIPEDCLVTPRDLGIRDAAFIAFKDQKPTKSALARDPWLLSKCVVSWDADGEAECYEIHDLNSKDTYIFKDRDSSSTEEWFRLIQFHALSVGSWRRRRPALANIMINGMHRS